MRYSEEDLTESLEAAMEKYPDAYAVLVRRHGMYVFLPSAPSQQQQTNCLATSGATMSTRRRRSVKGMFRLCLIKRSVEPMLI
jgi:hypothetical protein